MKGYYRLFCPVGPGSLYMRRGLTVNQLADFYCSMFTFFVIYSVWYKPALEMFYLITVHLFLLHVQHNLIEET